MRLLFKQRLFSWFDSYDIYTEDGSVCYTVKGQLAWGHLLKVYDAQGHAVGEVRERLLSLLPKFEVSCGGQYLGCIRKEFSLLRPRFNIDYNGWSVQGDWMGWDYTITGPGGRCIATVSKELLRMTDTYVLEIKDPADALHVLLFALAMDAEKCSSN